MLRQARALAARCIKTADNVRGPFYRRGAPLRERRLCSPDEPGEPLELSGGVIGLPECVPLPGAVLDVWQANARGLYSNMLGLGKADDPKTFRLRGRFRSDAQGRYSITTIVPGHYPWPFVRARHIHVIVTCPGYADLVTQIFFAGDRRLRWDPWLKRSSIIELNQGRGAFDFVLER